MPRYENRTTGHVVETSDAREGVTLKASGYVEQKARTAAVKAADSDAAKSTDKK